MPRLQISEIWFIYNDFFISYVGPLFVYSVVNAAITSEALSGRLGAGLCVV